MEDVSANGKFYRKFANKNKAADLLLQLDVFQEQRENDECQLLDSPNGVDLNSHVDVFYAILRQVCNFQRYFGTK